MSYKTYGEHEPVVIELKERVFSAIGGYPVYQGTIAMIEVIMHCARQENSSPEYRAAIADIFARASVEIQAGDSLHSNLLILAI